MGLLTIRSCWCASLPVLVVLLSPPYSASSPLPSLGQQALGSALAIDDWVVGLRRRLHQTPEIMFELPQTQRIVQETLRELGIEFEAKTGVVAEIGTGLPPIMALRADMDALPIEEHHDPTNPVPFRSANAGAMHACGHDAHMAMLLGAARVLQERHRGTPLPGTVRLIFQPGEEGGAGAQRMVAEGATRGVDMILALHVKHDLPTGTYGGREGALLAANAAFKVTVTGRGGHAAFPHQTVDPILCTVHIIPSLQALVSRETDPIHSAVVSVTEIQAGSGRNIIPDTVVFAGTLRALSPQIMARLRERLVEVSSLQAQAGGCSAVVDFEDDLCPPYPVTFNHKTAYEHGLRVAQELVPASEYITVNPGMGAEDFSFFQEQVPGAMFLLGTGNQSVGTNVPMHNSKFKVDEWALHYGVAFHVTAALKFLGL